MAKFKLSIEETRTLHHEIVVESESKIDVKNSLISTENNVTVLSVEEYADYLRYDGIKILEITEDEDGEREFECYDIEELGDKE